ARLAVSSPIPALPPITTTVCPSNSGSRRVGVAAVAPVMTPPMAAVRASSCRRCDHAAEGLQRTDVDLREGGERLDGVAQDVVGYPYADGQGGLLQPFARLGTEGVRAGQHVAVAEEGSVRRRRG